MSRAGVFSNGSLAVVAALDEELSVLAERAGAGAERRRGDLRVREAELAGRPLLLARIGDGRARAERSLETLLDDQEVDRMVLIGVSGGLTPGLAPGELVVAGEVRDGTTPVAAPDAAWAAATGARSGRVVSVDRIACSVEDKAELLARLPAGPGPAVVDLESASFARAAAARQIPFLVARSVCDPAEKPLPFDLNRCLDEGGGVSRAKVLRYAMFHPAVLGPLMQLREQVARCAGVLADFVETLATGDAGRWLGSEDRDTARSRG